MQSERILQAYNQADISGLNDMFEQTEEEIGELLQAICKYKRMLKKDKTLRMPKTVVEYKLAEEIADVEICLLKLKYLLQNKYTVEEIIKDKLDRTEKEMEK